MMDTNGIRYICDQRDMVMGLSDTVVFTNHFNGHQIMLDGMGVPYSQTNPYSLCLSMLGGIPQLVCLKTIVAPIKVGKVNHHYFSGILWFFFLVALL